jgi:biotin transport system substrate-specific component
MQQDITIAGFFRPGQRTYAFVYDCFIVICGSLLVALSAHIRFYLPFSPVPVTAQTFVVLVLGILLGSQKGALALTLYLAEGIAGLPVFAGGFGASALAGPTGGYLVGFIPAAYIVGRLAEMGWDRHVITTAAAMIIGDAVLLTFGFVWLAILIGIKTALISGFLVFIPGDVVKVALAAVSLPAAWKLLGYLNNNLKH